MIDDVPMERLTLCSDHAEGEESLADPCKACLKFGYRHQVAMRGQSLEEHPQGFPKATREIYSLPSGYCGIAAAEVSSDPKEVIPSVDQLGFCGTRKFE